LFFFFHLIFILVWLYFNYSILNSFRNNNYREKGEPKLATNLDGHHHPLILTLINHNSDMDIMLTDHNPDAPQSHPFAILITLSLCIKMHYSFHAYHLMHFRLPHFEGNSPYCYDEANFLNKCHCHYVDEAAC